MCICLMLLLLFGPAWSVTLPARRGRALGGRPCKLCCKQEEVQGMDINGEFLILPLSSMPLAISGSIDSALAPCAAVTDKKTGNFGDEQNSGVGS